MIRIFLFIFTLCLSFGISGQNNKKAVELLEKSAEIFKNSTGIEASFLLKDETAGSKTIHSFEGILKSKEEKFVIDMPDMQTWFDGKTQWSFLKSNQEVNITSPTPEEIAIINPVALLRLYKKGYHANYKGIRKINGKEVNEIELVAENGDLPWRKIFLRLDSKSNLPSSILIRDKKGNNTNITFLKIREGLNLPDSAFVFNKKEFPNVEIIDLR
ncbi:MAG: LolA-like putative outer membrane lipoprotein chaperone [Bacteroidales bacterium]